MKQPTLSPKTKRHLRDLLAGGISESTRQAYDRDLRYIGHWHQARYGRALAVPTQTNVVKQFVVDHLQGLPKKVERQLLNSGAKRVVGPLAFSSIKRRVMTLSVIHSEAGLTNPMADPGIKLLMRRAARGPNIAPKRRKQAATADVVGELLATCDASLHGLRDAAIISVGFASGGRRRSELAGLKMDHLYKTRDGYQWRIPSSKTDQTGRGHTVPITGDAARHLKRWIVKSGIRSGHVFRGILGEDVLLPEFKGQGITRMIKRRAEQAGYDPRHMGAHSLRSGFITEGGKRGAFIGDLMMLSGHKCVTVALDYYRVGHSGHSPWIDLLDTVQDRR